ncbi:hypothetical protein BJX61DRAFT_529341 [Aspergillus egyptiacus]|nr:hypothetical protein BJX61DRAFT_529341 [Aspergillus egyptiacus]
MHLAGCRVTRSRNGAREKEREREMVYREEAKRTPEGAGRSWMNTASLILSSSSRRKERNAGYRGS